MRIAIRPIVRARRIRKARESKRLTQKALAALVDAWPSQVHYWERGEFCPSQRHLVKLSEVLEVPLDHLMAERG